MSVSRRSRRAAAVGIGALALALVGGPALAADVPDPTAGTEIEHAVEDAAAAVSQIPAPAPAPVVAPAPRAAAPAPVAPQPARVAGTPPKKPAAPPVETVTNVVSTLVDVVIGQIDQKSPPPPAPAPPAGGPASGPVSASDSTVVPLAAPVQPFRKPALSAAVVEANEAVEAIADAALSRSLGAFARDLAGDLPAGELLLPGPVSVVASPLTMSEMLKPSTAAPEGFLPSGRSGSGPAGLPALLVAVAAAAVAVSAVGNGAAIRRRR